MGIGGAIERDGRPVGLIARSKRSVGALERGLRPGETLVGGVTAEGGGAKIAPRRGSGHGGDGREGGSEGCRR